LNQHPELLAGIPEFAFQPFSGDKVPHALAEDFRWAVVPEQIFGRVIVEVFVDSRGGGNPGMREKSVQKRQRREALLVVLAQAQATASGKKRVELGLVLGQPLRPRRFVERPG
jgi:hypothetical protein